MGLAKKNYIIIGLIIVVFSLTIGRYAVVIIRNTWFPERATEKFEYGRYSSWAWTPDGRIIYVINKEQMEHTKGMGSMGYWNKGTVTQIRIINADGTNDTLIKETFYQSAQQKIDRRYAEIRKENNGKLPYWLADDANRESTNGGLDERYPDAPLAHIGWIDWNAKNNKLVFVANDGKGKTGIAISDPEFKEVKWIIKYDNSNYIHVAPEWDSNANRFAYSLGDDVIVYDENGDMLNNVKISQCGTKIGWIPNGRGFLTKRGIIDVKGNWIKEFKESVNDPSISPDGKWVIHNQGIMNLETGEKRSIQYMSSYPKWSPDGKNIIDGWEGGVKIYDFIDGRIWNPQKVTQEQELDPESGQKFSKGL